LPERFPNSAALHADLADAIEHGRAMAAARAAHQAATIPESTQRRRLIREHNRRLRARAIKKPREEG
jgi:hypothetical protein